MLYFSLNNTQNRHLGFLVLMDEENTSQINESHGYYAIKAQADMIDQQACSAEWKILTGLSQQSGLKWYKKNDYLQLCNTDNKIIGQLRQQYLFLYGKHFILNDLTGTL